MQRIKYNKYGNQLYCRIYDIYARPVNIHIEEYRKKYSVIIARKDKTETSFELSSLQNAKRKVRKILKEEFEVNLGDEVRSKLCI